MAGDALENKAEAIRALRDTMATLRWELMCNQPILHRADITPEQLQKEMYRVIDDYPPLNWEYESSCILRSPPPGRDRAARSDSQAGECIFV